MKFFDIIAKSNRKADVLLYGSIASWANVNARSFGDKLKELEKDYDEIDIRINSPGGSVFEGFAIYNLIQASPLMITTTVDGMAASMGSILAIAGQKTRMARNARIMIHQGSGGAYGQSKQLKQYAALLDSVNSTLAEVYAEKTGKDVKWIQDNWMKDGEDKWFTAKEAKAAGLIDEIVESRIKDPKEKTKAEHDTIEEMAAFYNDQLISNLNTDNKTEMKEIAKALGLPESATEQEIQAAIAKLLETSAKSEKLIIVLGEKTGVITSENKSKYERLIKADLDLAAEFISEAKPAQAAAQESGEGEGKNKKEQPQKEATINDLLAEMKKQNGGQQKGERDDWKLRDWEKKDPKGLHSMILNKPEDYKALFKASYDKELDDEQIKNLQKSVRATKIFVRPVI